MADPQTMIERYLAGELTEAEHAELAQWLSENEANRRAFFAEVEFYRTVRSSLLSEQQARALGGSGAFDAQTLEALREIQASAQNAELVDLDERARAAALAQNKDDIEDAGSLSAHDLAAVGGYLLRRAVLSKPALLGAAACIAIFTLVVMLPWNGSTTQTLKQADTQPQSAAVVATLTGEHNARWSGQALVRGSELKAGQTLTLTEGIAEITTAKGAVAVIQGPAKVELIDNPNAIRLHTGKLVGICQTLSSQGFVVHTPHMDVIDLGTRFGVDATRREVTSVHVLDGVVRAALPTEAGSETGGMTLSAGQAVRASDDDHRLVHIEVDRDRFALSATPRLQSAGTGYGLAMGDIDPNWRVVAINGQPIAEGGEMRVVYPNHGDPASSQWLLVPKAIQPQDNSERTITCRVSFVVPAGFDPARSQLVLGFNADFIVKGIRVNGKAIAVPENELDREAPLTELAIQDAARPGQNTLEIEIYDIDSHSALRAAFELRDTNP